MHRKTHTLESLFNKAAGLKVSIFIKKGIQQLFSCEYCKIFKNRFFIEHLQWLPLNKILEEILDNLENFVAVSIFPIFDQSYQVHIIV